MKGKDLISYNLFLFLFLLQNPSIICVVEAGAASHTANTPHHLDLEKMPLPLESTHAEICAQSEDRRSSLVTKTTC